MVVVGYVSNEEKKELEKLFERKNALIELMGALKKMYGEQINGELYEKIVMDLVNTNKGLKKWWHEGAEKYKWQVEEGKMWNIDMATNEIILG